MKRIVRDFLYLAKMRFMKKIVGLLLITLPMYTSEAQQTANPLLQPWKGNYGGVPAFGTYSLSDFKPAITQAIAERLREVDAIAQQKAPATFANTIVALERAGKTYQRVRAVFELYSANLNTPEFETIELEMAPKFSEMSSAIYQNAALFARIAAVHNGKEMDKLTPEQKRLVQTYYAQFVKEGALANAKSKQRIAAINKALAGLFTQFSQNQLADENQQYLLLETEADFAGLPQELADAARQEAQERQLKALGCIANTRSSIEPFLTFSSQRSLREKAFQLFVNRGDNTNAYNNNATVVAILKLRAEKAKLLGFPTFAHWSLSNTMAKQPQRTLDLMLSVWEPALLKVQDDVKAMQQLIAAEGGTFALEPWDYRYYAEKVRKEKYAVDANEIKPYMQLEPLREGMFWVAETIFDLTFAPVTDVPVFHPDVRVWEVRKKSTGKVVGVWYFDPYARKGKRSGAWMTAYRDQSRFDGEVLTLVSNNCNFIKGKPGEPVLISWDDANTLFHEFGHALHGLCSDVNYPLLSGTNTPRDYVEFPSQILERWLSTPEVLNRFALHYQTGAPMPMALVERLEAAATFNEGFSTVETLSSALVDMQLHLLEQPEIDPKTFEAEALKALRMPKEIVMRHRIPQFGHIFSGDDYAAGYYGYLWADVISADATEAFTVDGKGLYDPVVAKRLLDYVFKVGNTLDPEEAYPKFRGKKASTAALMRARNFPVK